MEAEGIYVKTLYGREEVRARTRHLSARGRATLIMIDGRRGLSELRMLSPAPHEVEQHLKTFLEAGLIAPIGMELSASDMSNSVSAPELPLAYAATVLDMPLTNPDLEKARCYVLEVARDTLGAEAASFASKLAALDNTQELLNLAHHLREALHRFTNVKDADQFWETVREIAPKT